MPDQKPKSSNLELNLLHYSCLIGSEVLTSSDFRSASTEVVPKPVASNSPSLFCEIFVLSTIGIDDIGQLSELFWLVS